MPSFFKAKKPKMFPRDVGGALAVFLYNNLTIVHSDQCFERAFMDSDKLPENVRDLMKPKDEIPQQLIDTANELKKWANQLLELNGMKEAFEKTTNRVTAEVAKKVGELVANQMISESTWNYKENREHLAELSAKIYLESEENKIIAMFALLFRLVVQTPDKLIKYYGKNSEEIHTINAHFYIDHSLIKKQLCKKHLFDIHQRFIELRSSITHHVAIGLVAMECEDRQRGLAQLAYKELQMWFVARMEFHGLALLELCKENAHMVFFHELKGYYDMFRRIMLTTNATQLVAILSALLIYFFLHFEKEDDLKGNGIVRYMTNWLLDISENSAIGLDLPSFNKYDRLLGRLSKCFSPKYLPWTAFKYNCETSALLLGYVQGLKSGEPEKVDPNGTYIGPDGIESYRKDAFITSEFSEALDAAQNDILWRSRKKEGLVNVKLIGFIIGKCVWDQCFYDDSHPLLGPHMREMKQKKEEKKAAERERLLALEEEEAKNNKNT